MDTELVENPEFADPRDIYREPLSFLAAIIDAADDIERHSFATIYEERWPRIRFGERDKIPAAIRRLVFERDGGCCLSCGIPLTIRTAQLDHIVPWSAGGSDTSDNLRILCQPCNETRSNFRSGLDYQYRPPVAFVCVACFHLQAGEEEPAAVIPGMVAAFCGYCGLVSPTCPRLVY